MNDDIEFELVLGNGFSEPSVDVYKIKMSPTKIEKETLSITSANRIWSWKPDKRDKPEYNRFAPAEIKPVLYKENSADKGQCAILTINNIYDIKEKYLYSEVLVLPYIKDTNGYPLPPKSPLLKLPLNENIGNWHSVELIPDSNGLIGLISVVDTNGTVYVFTKEGKIKNTFKLPHAHGLVWDNKTSTLFALGHTGLQIYQLDPENSTNLKLLTTLDFSEYYENKNVEREEDKDGGHDLYLVPDEKKLFLTTGERTFKFDIGEYEKLFPKGGKILERYKLRKGEKILKPYQPMFKIDSKYWQNIASDKVPPKAKGLKDRVTSKKGGVKSISQVPGTSVVIAHAAPWFADDNELAYPYISNILLVATGPEDKPLPDDKLLDIDLTKGHKIEFSEAIFYKARVLIFPK
ncbi:5804_t:CDS:1 [Ambispora gerdemannii]|uniref:5804_t:CDS:1 n=1 Tax=Ambispora gerdemannii TaxID=144530 RepID=A0A9N8ZPB3_9GLOM|nr:5804_t:CDS:1 [Ambispora gerdemannii]